MMFLSIGQRIYQYGITENRYYILVLGIWISLIMLYFSIKKPLKNIIIPISLSVIVLNSVLGPLSSYSISKYSQNRRLNDILNRNSMLLGGSIVSNPDVSDDDKREISNIINYFDMSHSLDDIKILNDDFETIDMSDVFGFSYQPRIYIIESDRIYFYYITDLTSQAIEIEAYQHFLQQYSWQEEDIIIGDFRIARSMGSNILSLSKDNEVVMTIDTEEAAMERIREFEPVFDNRENQRSPNEMTYEIEGNDVRVKLIFTNISGNKEDSNIEIDSIEYILLINDLNK